MMPLGRYRGLSISSSSILVLFLSFLHKERNPVRAGGFQAATFFFMMQATVEMIDATNPMQPIKKDVAKRAYHSIRFLVGLLPSIPW